MNATSTLAPIRDSFRAIIRAVAPASAGLDEDGWRRAEEIIEGAVRDRSVAMRRQLVLFVKVLEVLSRLRYGRSLGRLAPDRLHSLLLGFERSPVLLLRRGFWGVRTLAYMGYYGQVEVRAGVGYRADPRGWGIREDAVGPWSDRAGAGEPEAGILVVGGATGPNPVTGSRNREARRDDAGGSGPGDDPRGRSGGDDHA